jgi:restriction system protein
MAAKRQWKAPSSAATEALLARAASLPARDLQAWLTQAWQAEGYTVTTRQQADADIQLARDSQLTLVQTKRSKAGVHGIEPLRALHDAAQKAGAASAYVVLQGDLSENARLFARDQHITVLQNKELAALLHKAPQP